MFTWFKMFISLVTKKKKEQIYEKCGQEKVPGNSSQIFCLFFFKMLIIFHYTLNSSKFFSDISVKQDSDEGVCSRI